MQKNSHLAHAVWDSLAKLLTIKNKRVMSNYKPTLSERIKIFFSSLASTLDDVFFPLLWVIFVFGAVSFIIMYFGISSDGDRFATRVDRSFDETWDNIKATFKDNRLYGIEDEWITSVDTAATIGNGYGLKVTYKYGQNERICAFYMDREGNTVPISVTATDIKSNGYSRSLELAHYIDENGDVKFDWFSVILVILGAGLVILWCFVALPDYFD